MRNSLRMTVVIFATLIVIVSVKLMMPKPINWQESYSRSDKIPYGESLLYALLPTMFPSDSLHFMSETPYQELHATEQLTKRNLIYVTRAFDPDATSLQALLQTVRAGSTVFMAAENLSTMVSDSLGVSTTYIWYDSTWVNFRNTQLSNEKYFVRTIRTNRCFDSIPAENCQVLGCIDGFLESSTGQTKHTTVANFIRLKIGEGAVYLHCDPLLFSNYAVSDDTLRPYVFQALSFLPQQQTWWDEYYKPLRRDNSSELRFVFSDRRLRIAYYVIIGSTLIFFVFYSKRRQRIIPVIQPPRNATVDFVNTVGMLYYEHRDSASIIEKKILYFYDFLRTRFYLSEVRADPLIYERIAAKSGMSIDDVATVFGKIEAIRRKRAYDDTDVMNVHKTIEEFRRRCA